MTASPSRSQMTTENGNSRQKFNGLEDWLRSVNAKNLRIALPHANPIKATKMHTETARRAMFGVVLAKLAERKLCVTVVRIRIGLKPMMKEIIRKNDDDWQTPETSTPTACLFVHDQFSFKHVSRHWNALNQRRQRWVASSRQQKKIPSNPSVVWVC